MTKSEGLQLGKKIAPPRFLLFLALIVVGTPIGVSLLGWSEGGMIAFDVAALVFLVSVWPLIDSDADDIRDTANQNDANRALLLGVTGIVTTVILVAVASELSQKGSPKPWIVVLIVATLALAWTFSNMIYTLHYAHLFYARDKNGDDKGGLEFPKTEEPEYWDFIYFSFCLGMTFQTSDVDSTDLRFRKVMTAHCLAAFVFNLGILAFTINVLGGG